MLTWTFIWSGLVSTVLASPAFFKFQFFCRFTVFSFCILNCYVLYTIYMIYMIMNYEFASPAITEKQRPSQSRILILILTRAPFFNYITASLVVVFTCKNLS